MIIIEEALFWAMLSCVGNMTNVNFFNSKNIYSEINSLVHSHHISDQNVKSIQFLVNFVIRQRGTITVKFKVNLAHISTMCHDSSAPSVLL